MLALRLILCRLRSLLHKFLSTGSLLTSTLRILSDDWSNALGSMVLIVCNLTYSCNSERSFWGAGQFCVRKQTYIFTDDGPAAPLQFAFFIHWVDSISLFMVPFTPIMVPCLIDCCTLFYFCFWQFVKNSIVLKSNLIPTTIALRVL